MSDPPVPNLVGVPSGQDSDPQDAQNPGGSLNKPRQSRVQRIWGWVTGKHEHIKDWGLIALTAILAISTMRYCSIASDQRQAMIDTANQSRRANDLTENALRRATESENEARVRAERTTNATENAAGSMSTQAKATRDVANAARSSARAAEKSVTIAQQGVRGFLSLWKLSLVQLAVGKQVIIDVTWFNHGNTAAEITGGLIKIAKSASNTRPQDNSGPPLVIPCTVAPHDGRTQRYSFNFNLSAEEIDAIQRTSSGRYLIFFGDAKYRTAGIEDSLPFCSYYISGLPGGNDFAECR